MLGDHYKRKSCLKLLQVPFEDVIEMIFFLSVDISVSYRNPLLISADKTKDHFYNIFVHTHTIHSENFPGERILQ